MPAIDSHTFDLSQLPSAENEVFEFKSSAAKPNALAGKLACAVSGFANSGGGRFVAGVTDSGDADGGLAVENFVGRQKLRDWADQVIDQVKPTPRYSIELVESSDGRGVIDAGKAVLVVSIGESNCGPHMAHDHCYYIRAGAHTVSAQHFLVEAIWAKRHFAKPRLTHLIRQNPNDAEILQIGLIALTDSPAVDVQLTMQPLPGSLRGHNCSEFPIGIAVIDKHTPFFFDITTRCDTERNREEAFCLNVTYCDLASNRYTHETQINLFRSLPSIRFGKKGINEIAKALESIATEMVQRHLGPPNADLHDDERDILAIREGAPIRFEGANETKVDKSH